MKKQLLFITLPFLLMFAAKAQTATPELLASAGDSFTNTDYSLNWSLGEIMTESYTNTEFILTQGFHQPYLSSVSIDEKPMLNVSVWPNPTDHILYVTALNQNAKPLSYTLKDLTGKELLNGNFMLKQALDLDNYPAGMYMLSIYGDKIPLHTFKIIKKSLMSE
jgi:hypothetical protein